MTFLGCEENFGSAGSNFGHGGNFGRRRSYSDGGGGGGSRGCCMKQAVGAGEICNQDPAVEPKGDTVVAGSMVAAVKGIWQWFN